MRRSSIRFAVAVAVAGCVLPALAQNSSAKYRRNVDYSYSQGVNRRVPRNFDKYYYSKTNGYAVPAYIMSPIQPQRRLMLGPVRAYTPDEYARLVLATLDAPTVQPAPKPTESVVKPAAPDQIGPKQYMPVEVKVAEVLDRGLLLLETREEVRLRGVKIPSEVDPNENKRVYARDAMRRLRDMVRGQMVNIEFVEPLRDGDGTLLAIVRTRDGVELNSLLLQDGLGRFSPKDFFETSDTARWQQAENSARESKTGLWSIK